MTHRPRLARRTRLSSPDHPPAHDTGRDYGRRPQAHRHRHHRKAIAVLTPAGRWAACPAAQAARPARPAALAVDPACPAASAAVGHVHGREVSFRHLIGLAVGQEDDPLAHGEERSPSRAAAPARRSNRRCRSRSSSSTCPPDSRSRSKRRPAGRSCGRPPPSVARRSLDRRCDLCLLVTRRTPGTASTADGAGGGQPPRSPASWSAASLPSFLAEDVQVLLLHQERGVGRHDAVAQAQVHDLVSPVPRSRRGGGSPSAGSRSCA